MLLVQNNNVALLSIDYFWLYKLYEISLPPGTESDQSLLPGSEKQQQCRNPNECGPSGQ